MTVLSGGFGVLIDVKAFTDLLLLLQTLWESEDVVLVAVWCLVLKETRSTLLMVKVLIV